MTSRSDLSITRDPPPPRDLEEQGSHPSPKTQMGPDRCQMLPPAGPQAQWRCPHGSQPSEPRRSCRTPCSTAVGLRLKTPRL